MSHFQTGKSVANVQQVEIIKKWLADRDAAAWEVMHKLLKAGPQTSRDLILAVGRSSYREGARLGAALRGHEKAGRIVRAGVVRGPGGHPNILWQLA